MPRPGIRGVRGCRSPLFSHLFDEELDLILSELPPGTDPEVIEKYRQARQISEEMIRLQRFNPV